MLRNCATQRYMNLMKVRGKRKILLTGTPLQNNLVELISLLYFTMRKLFDKVSFLNFKFSAIFFTIFIINFSIFKVLRNR